MFILKKIKPLLDSVITTGDRYDEVYTTGGLIDPGKSGSFKEYQKVLFSSEQAIARGIKPGDTVLVNFFNYARPVQKKNSLTQEDYDEKYNASYMFQIPTIDISNKECLNVRVGDIMFIIEEMEEASEVNKSSFKKKDNKMIKEIK